MANKDTPGQSKERAKAGVYAIAVPTIEARSHAAGLARTRSGARLLQRRQPRRQRLRQLDTHRMDIRFPGACATRTVSDAPFGFGGRALRGDRKRRRERQTPAVRSPRTERTDRCGAPRQRGRGPVSDNGPQLVGLTVKPGRSMLIVTERISSGIPSRIDGNGPETAVRLPSLLTCSHTGTTTFPRLYGPATAGTTTESMNG